jgi:hypothetical protein
VRDAGVAERLLPTVEVLTDNGKVATTITHIVPTVVSAFTFELPID